MSAYPSPQNGGTRNRWTLSNVEDLLFCSLFFDKGFNALLFHTDVEKIKYKQGPDQSGTLNEATKELLMWLYGTLSIYVGQNHVQPSRF